jgi:hypothetical protein
MPVGHVVAGSFYGMGPLVNSPLDIKSHTSTSTVWGKHRSQKAATQLTKVRPPDLGMLLLSHLLWFPRAFKVRPFPIEEYSCTLTIEQVTFVNPRDNL